MSTKIDPQVLIKPLVWAVVTVLVFLLFQYSPVLKRWELGMFDSWFQWRGPRKAPDEVVFVLVDETTADSLGWPLPRAAYAELITALQSFEAATMVFDLAFYDRREKDDAELLAQKSRQAENVIHAFELIAYDQPENSASNHKSVSNLQTRFAINIPGADKIRPYQADEALFPNDFFLPSFNEAGSVTLVQDIDGHFRRIPLLFEFAEHHFPALSLKAVQDYFAITETNFRFGATKSGYYLQVETGTETFKLPVNERSQVLLNFYGDLPFFKHYSFLQVMNSYHAIQRGETPFLSRESLKDKIVVVGVALSGVGDIQPMPYSASFPGVGFHATAIANILDDSLLVEAPIMANIGVIIVFNFLLLGLLKWRQISTWPRLTLFVGILFLLNYSLFWIFKEHFWWLKSLQIDFVILVPLVFVIATDLILTRIEREQLEVKIDGLQSNLHESETELTANMSKLEELQKNISLFEQLPGNSDLQSKIDSIKKETAEEVEIQQNIIKQLLKDIEQSEKKINGLKQLIINPIGKYKLLRIEEDKSGRVKGFVIEGTKGKSRLLKPMPRLLTLIYYIAKSKLRGEEEGCIVYEQVNKKSGIYFIGMEDDFLEAAQKCNYQYYITHVEKLSGSKGAKSKFYTPWKIKVEESALTNPEFISEVVAKINKQMKPYGSPLIGGAAGYPPYPLLLEKVEIKSVPGKVS